VNPSQPSRPFLRLFSANQSAHDHAEVAANDVAASEVAANDADRNTHPVRAAQRPEEGAKRVDDQRAKHLRGSELLKKEDVIAGSVGPRRVEVSLAEIAPVLADAINHRRGWLSDFSDDTVSIDADLYEVLLAYQQMRRIDAA